jgi:hypothetical protein
MREADLPGTLRDLPQIRAAGIVKTLSDKGPGLPGRRGMKNPETKTYKGKITNVDASLVGSFCSDPHASYDDYGIYAEGCFDAIDFRAPILRAGNSRLCGSFVDPPSTSNEISRRFALWLAFFRDFSGVSKAVVPSGQAAEKLNQRGLCNKGTALQLAEKLFKNSKKCQGTTSVVPQVLQKFTWALAVKFQHVVYIRAKL